MAIAMMHFRAAELLDCNCSCNCILFLVSRFLAPRFSVFRQIEWIKTFAEIRIQLSFTIKRILKQWANLPKTYNADETHNNKNCMNHSTQWWICCNSIAWSRTIKNKGKWNLLVFFCKNCQLFVKYYFHEHKNFWWCAQCAIVHSLIFNVTIAQIHCLYAF